MVQDTWKIVWRQFKKSKIGIIAAGVLALFFLIGLYAPLLASSQPLMVIWEKKLYFPLFRNLFYKGFYTKPIDLFYNVLMCTFPLMILGLRYRLLFYLGALLQLGLFLFFMTGVIRDPKSSAELSQLKAKMLESQNVYREDPLLTPIRPYPTWNFELKYMTDYAKLSLLLHVRNERKQHIRLLPYAARYEEKYNSPMPTLYSVDERNKLQIKKHLEEFIEKNQQRYQTALAHLPELYATYLPFSHSYLIVKNQLKAAATPEERAVAEQLQREQAEQSKEAKEALADAREIIQSYRDAQAEAAFMNEREQWITDSLRKITLLIPPLIRNFHWEDDAGGSQSINRIVPWWELTRINRKDLLASLLFGIRVSLIVGFLAVSIALLIGFPLGTISGYFAGRVDLFICRLIEIWEAMPTFFMLLLIIALTQCKSIFLVVAVLGFFGWTGFARFMRAEVLKQRSLAYVLACKSLGYRNYKIMFSHILPNAIAPVLTLLPFSMMAAITSEAGLSFLGLGEEGSTSWGVLMDEGRMVFPAESYLLWLPAILLTLLLISIALVGDVLRDSLDPKMRS